MDVLPGEKDKREKGLSLSVFAGQAVALTAAALRDNILEYASRHTGVPTSDCRLDDDAVICGNRRIPLSELHAAGIRARHRFEARRKAYLSPLTVAFNAHGVRVAVNRITAEIRILHSVHAADIGRLLNPMQCRGQIDGAIAMGFGWTLCENMVHDASGAIVNPTLRNSGSLPLPTCRPAKCFSPTLTTGLGRSAPSRKESAPSTQSLRPSPMPSPTPPACASHTCR